MARRRPFPAKVKAAALERAKGRCEECTVRLGPGQFHYDHKLPDGLGGEPTLENCAVLCKACHGEKTYTQDNPAMARADRLHKKRIGARKPKGRPMPGSRDSGWQHKMNGDWVRR